MKKSVKITLVVVGVMVLGGLIALGSRVEPKKVLYTSLSCPFCRNVEQYIEENNVKDYLEFQELEVSQNAGNAQLFRGTAKRCGIEKPGVPLFFDGEKCYEGDVDITDYFNSQK